MLENAVAWVGGEVGGGGALHMLCKVSLLPLLVSTFACNFFKLKRASRSHAKTGFCCFGTLFVGFQVPLGVARGSPGHFFWKNFDNVLILGWL